MSKKMAVAAGIVLAILLLAAALFAEGVRENVEPAEHYTISVNAAGTAVASKGEVPPFADAGLEGWTFQMLSASGVDFYIFRLAPGAVEYPVHGSPVAWLGYILKGSGQLMLGASDNSVASVLNFSEGDFLIFEPNALHGWKGGLGETDILFITPTAPAP